MIAAALVLLSGGCATPGTGPSAPPHTAARRAFAPTLGGRPALSGVSYGPFRAGQRPGGPGPSAEQILEDLRIIAARWEMIRVYSSRGPTRLILETVRAHQLPLKVVVGAWIAPDDDAASEAEVAGAIALAREFSEQVVAVSIGNETQVSWSAHRSTPESLIGSIRQTREAIEQPVTTADDYSFWLSPESQAVAEEVDFLLLHAYAMWNGQPLESAVPWTASALERVQAVHPERLVVLGETGWATDLNPAGEEVRHIAAPAGEAEQAVFFRELSAWTSAAALPCFYFEAFDEPWKGGDDPRDVEKHWGLFYESRQPKQAMRDSMTGGRDVE